MRQHLGEFLEHANASHDAPLPKYVRDELRTYLRCGAWLAKHDDDARVVDGALGRCAQLALFRGDVRKIADEQGEDGDEPEKPEAEGAAVEHDGYNLEASVRIAGGDDFGREHLMRYCARPPLALGRLSLLPGGGKVAYRIKRLRGGRAKVRVLTPLELLARLAALVPPPRHPLIRFHGALAPRSSWRRDVVPKPRAPADEVSSQRHEDEDKEPNEKRPQAAAPQRSSPELAMGLVPHTQRLTPNVIAVHHWERLRAGALLATSPRIEWAKLLRRTFDADALACPKCDGRIRVLDVVDDETTARAILAELGIDSAPRPRARDPSVPFADAPLVSYDALS